MGYRAAGKSSAGNTILGREEFDVKRSAQCVRRHGEVADRHITVIEAPGWWSNYTVEKSPELLKQEIVRSVSQCPPGPHAVLLIIRVDIRFNEDERKALQEHLDLLSERVWSHTIVLFTHGDSLLDTSIAQHIESERQDLQWLLDKCGNRYHVLNNQNRSDHTQIKELLEKIEETVARNKGCHFEIDRNIFQELKERRSAEEERAKERLKRMKKRRESIRSQMSESTYFIVQPRLCFVILLCVSLFCLFSCRRSTLLRDLKNLKIWSNKHQFPVTLGFCWASVKTTVMFPDIIRIRIRISFIRQVCASTRGICCGF